VFIPNNGEALQLFDSQGCPAFPGVLMRPHSKLMLALAMSVLALGPPACTSSSCCPHCKQAPAIRGTPRLNTPPKPHPDGEEPSKKSNAPLVIGGVVTMGFGSQMSKRTPNGAYVDAMLKAYRRTLENQVREALGLDCTPIHFVIRGRKGMKDSARARHEKDDTRKPTGKPQRVKDAERKAKGGPSRGKKDASRKGKGEARQAKPKPRR